MTRILALVAALAALVALAVLATRRRPEACATWLEPEDGVQPWDVRTVTLAADQPPGDSAHWHSPNPGPTTWTWTS